MIRFADIEVPRASIADLATRLEKAGEARVAHRLALAIDKNLDELYLTRDDYWPIIRLLDKEPIPGLEMLHRALGDAERALAPAIKSARERRMAENEVFFREINERLEEGTRETAPLVVLCECADEDCAQRLTLSHSEYEAVRSDATQFLVAHGHVEEDIEDIVLHTDRFDVVRKSGIAGEIAKQADAEGA